MTKLTHNISKFVISFLEENNINLNEEWSSKKVQKSLEKIIKKKERKDKNNNKPKRNSSAYLLFCNDERKVIKQSNPNLNNKEVTNELARRWNVIKADKNQKKLTHYELLAKKDKERYISEMKQFNPPTQIKKGGNNDKNAPARCKSAYIFYCIENRDLIKKDNPNLSHHEVTTKMGIEWKKLKNDKSRLKEYNKYVDLALKDKERYTREKKIYMSSEQPVEDEEQEQEVEKKEEIKLSAYQLYCQDNRELFKQNNPELNPKQITRELAKSWKVLDRKTKKHYKKLSKK